ncbi:MAG: protein kinase [Parachlamydiaceae bacterium]|nr:protein kinase [Parachlamydiaceae bacterium]
MVKMVRNIHKFKRKAIAQASRNFKPEEEHEKKFSLRERTEWKFGSRLDVLVSASGRIYLSSVNRIIGKGSFKSTWEGYDVTTGQKTAFGVPHKKKDRYWKENKEVELQNKVQGTGVCVLHTCCEIGTNAKGEVIKGEAVGPVFKYYNGGDLESNIEDLKKKTAEQRIQSEVFIMKNIAEGLERIHSEKIVHADIKLENIFLSKDENGVISDAVLGDFGIATQGEVSEGLEGTPDFMSPRQWMHKGKKYSDDIWALGITFYKMILDPEKVPRFSNFDLFFKLTYFKSSDWPESHPYQQRNIREAAIVSLKTDFNAELEKQFNMIRPQENGAIGYDLIQIMKERLCWDMLFSDPQMTAVDVFKRTQEIQAELEKVLKAPTEDSNSIASGVLEDAMQSKSYNEADEILPAELNLPTNQDDHSSDVFNIPVPDPVPNQNVVQFKTLNDSSSVRLESPPPDAADEAPELPTSVPTPTIADLKRNIESVLATRPRLITQDFKVDLKGSILLANGEEGSEDGVLKEILEKQSLN